MKKQKSKATFNYAPGGRTLKAFHEDQSFIRVLIGPLGSGKTQSAIAEIFAQIINQVPDANGLRRSRVAIVRNTAKQLYQTTIPDWLRVTQGLGLGKFRQTSPIAWEAEFPLADGTTVQAVVIFDAFDLPGDQHDARGMQLSGLWLNEVAGLAKVNVDALIARVKRYPSRAEVPGANYFVIADTNAPDADHWLARLAKAPPGSHNWSFHIQPGAVIKEHDQWVVNPLAENLANLPDRYYEDQLGGKDETWIRKNLGNEFVIHIDGRPVHPGFNYLLHSRDSLQASASQPVTVGIDFGLTPAAVILQKQPNGQWFALKELVTDNCDALRFAAILRETIEHDEILSSCPVEYWGDPAGGQRSQTRGETAYQVMEEEDIFAQPVSTNSWDIRKAALDKLLGKLLDGQPAFLVDRSECPMLTRALAGEYCVRRLQVAGFEKYHDRPDKGPFSHVAEACHYALVGADETVGESSAEWDAVNAELGGRWHLPDHYYE